jgi:hypothetical protein
MMRAARCAAPHGARRHSHSRCVRIAARRGRLASQHVAAAPHRSAARRCRQPFRAQCGVSRAAAATKRARRPPRPAAQCAPRNRTCAQRIGA